MNTRYYREEDVKRALKINSFRNLSKDKVMQFASMIPYMDKDVAIAIINQFPVYADFGKAAIEQYSQTCKSILEGNRESQAATIKSYQYVLECLSREMDKDISAQERKELTERMIDIADKIAEADKRNKEYLLESLKTIGGVVLFVIIAVAGALGINYKGGSGKA